MPHYQTRRHLPYRAAQLYALVLDIERYPEFVPGYQAARIERHNEGMLWVAQSIGFGPVSVKFHSRAEYVPSGHIHIEAQDGPFRRLEMEWRFHGTADGCEVEFCVDYHLHGLLAPLLRRWLQLTAPQLVAVFARRAARIYGGTE